MSTSNSNNHFSEKSVGADSGWRRLLKIFAVGSIMVIMVLTGLRWSLTTDWVREMAKNQIERRVSEQLNGNLFIEKIEGDLLKSIAIKGIDITDSNNSTVIGIDSVNIAYSVWSLLGRRFDITDISVFGPEISAIENLETGWNLVQLLPQSETESEFLPEEGELNNFPIGIERLQIINGSISLRSPRLPDQELELMGLNIEAKIGILRHGYEFALERFEVAIREGRLSEDIQLALGGQYSEGNFTLDNLVMFTGSTLLQIYAMYRESDGSIDVAAMLEPLSWRDLLAFSEQPWLVQDVKLNAAIGGNLRNLNIELGLSAMGVEGLSMNFAGRVAPDPAVTNMSLKSGYLDLPLLTSNPSMPAFSSLDLQIMGEISSDNPTESTAFGSLTLDKLVYDTYSIDNISMEFQLDRDSLSAKTHITKGRQRIDGQIHVGNIYETPNWRSILTSRSLNPGFWLGDNELSGALTFEVELHGTSFALSQDYWIGKLTLHDSEMFGRSFDILVADLKFNEKDVFFNGNLQVGSGLVRLSTVLENYQLDSPSFTVSLETERLNLGRFVDVEAFSTDLNMVAVGFGTGLELADLNFNGEVDITDTVINGAKLDRFTTRLLVENSIAYLSDTYLESTFARGSLHMIHHLTDFNHIANRVDFDMEMMDVGPLAPLIGADYMSAKGNVKGVLRTPGGISKLELTADLGDIRLDSIRIAGLQMKADLSGVNEYMADIDLRLNQAGYGGYTIDDLWVRSTALIRDSQIEANYRIDLNQHNRGSIMTQATLLFTDESIRINTNVLQLRNPRVRYDLVRPFQLTYRDDLIETDAIYMQGSEGAEFTFGMIQYAQNAFRGFIDAKDVDLGLIQELAIGQSEFTANLSGEIEFDVDTIADKYEMRADISVMNTNFREFIIDRMDIDLKLSEERLGLNYRAVRRGKEFVSWSMDVPFLPGDPRDFDETFFMEQVKGDFTLYDLDLSQEEAFLRMVGFEGTTGVLSAIGEIRGEAGRPEFHGNLGFRNGRLSNVPIDWFLLDWSYDHDRQHVKLASNLTSLQQEVLNLSGVFPFQIDWRTFNVIDTDSDNEMELLIHTREFNLAALNQFFDPELLRELGGTVNSNLEIRGQPQAPQINGTLNLSQGRAYLPVNNITLRNIVSAVEFEPDRITMRNLSAQSVGTFTSNGHIELDGFRPSRIDINFSARNFRVFDTRDIQAYVTFNTDLRGTVDEPRITGNFNLDRGYIFLDNFGDRVVEDVRLDDEAVSINDTMELWQQMAVEVKFSTERNFWVRNRSRPEINLQLNGELDLVKSRNRDLEVFGRMGVNDGFVMQLGKRFTFDQGDVVFSGPADNPELQIRTLYALRQPSDIKIWYVLGGTAKQPEFSYESDPEMELQDIVSYTVFGRPFHSLMAREQTITSRSDATVADAAIDVLLDRVEQLAIAQLGIDMLQIENSRASGQSGTTIKAGKFISDRLFVALLQELGNNPISQVMVEYQLRRNLELILTGSDSYNTGIDIRWKYDY